MNALAVLHLCLPWSRGRCEIQNDYTDVMTNFMQFGAVHAAPAGTALISTRLKEDGLIG